MGLFSRSVVSPMLLFKALEFCESDASDVEGTPKSLAARLLKRNESEPEALLPRARRPRLDSQGHAMEKPEGVAAVPVARIRNNNVSS